MVDVSKRPKKRPEGLGAKKSNPEKSLRPRPRPDYGKISEGPDYGKISEGLATVESRADFDPALSWNPIARLGFEGYNTDKVADFQFTPEIREQARRQNVDLTSFNPDILDNAFYTSSTASKEDVEKELATLGIPAEVRINTNPDDIVADVATATPSTWAHEMTHRGFDRIIESIDNHPEGPSAGIKEFKEKYGERAFSLLTEVDNEIVTEGFDYLEDKVLGYREPEDTLTRGVAGVKEMQKTLKADPEDRWEHNERKYEPYLKLMEAAQDILTASGEPPKSPKYEESMMDKLRIKLGFAEGGYASYEDKPMGLDDQMQGIGFEVPSAPVEDKPVSPMSRRPGFRGESAFDFSGFGDFLKENVSEEEFMSGLDNAAEWMVPFYESGTNMVNVFSEYTKPEEERDYGYIKEELGKAGTSAGIEATMWLLGGIVTKYGAKGLKALNELRKKTMDNKAAKIGSAAALASEAAVPSQRQEEPQTEFGVGFAGGGTVVNKLISKYGDEAVDFLKNTFQEVMTPVKATKSGVKKTGEPILRPTEELSSTLDPRMQRAMQADTAVSIMPGPGKFFDPSKKGYKGDKFTGMLKGSDIELDLEFGNYIQMGKGAPKDVSNETFENLFVSARPSEKKTSTSKAFNIKEQRKIKAGEENPNVQNKAVARANLYNGPSLSVDDMKTNYKAATGKTGPEVRTNLLQPERFKVVTGKGEQLLDHPIVAVETKGTDGKHFYTLDTQFVGPARMDRLTQKVKRKNPRTGEIQEEVPQPNLRPVTVGDVKLGQQVGTIKVGKREHPLYDYIEVDATMSAPKDMGSIPKFNEGGMAMDDQMQLMFKSSRTGYALGGEVDAIDPVSGNEVPPGATEQEVRDDITIQVSQGEYVVPADVTRYYGIKFFEDLRNNAKAEMSGLQEDGRIGGQPISEDPDELTEDEMAILQEVMSSEEQMGMAIGGTVAPVEANIPDPYQQQATMYSSKPMGMATGGVTQLDPFGNPISPTAGSSAPAVPGLAPVDTTSGNIYGLDKPEQTTPTVDIPVGGPTTGLPPTTPDTGSEMRTVFFIHKDGRRISVLMLGSRPISSVPADFTEFVEDTPENRAKIGFGETEAGPATEGATEKVDTNDDQDQTDDIDIKTKVDPNTPEGVQAMYEDSGVNVKDPLAGAKSALEGKIGVSKELGALAGAINPFLGVAAGVANAASQLTALSKAQANLKMAEFLGKDDDAAAIQAEIDKFLKDAPNAVKMLDDVVAKGDRRFNNALEAATSMKASKDTPSIWYDELSEKGKANVKKYIEDSTEGYTVVIGKDTKSTIDSTPLREGTLVKTSTKDTGESLGGTKIGTDKTGTVNVYTPTTSTPRPVVRPDTTTPTTTSTSKPSKDVEKAKTTNVVNNTGRDVTIGKTTSGGMDAGDGFVWEKKEGTNAVTRKYVGTSSADKGGGSEPSQNTSSGSCCFIMLEARYGNGTMDEVVRRYRDEYMTDRNRRGYYRLAEVLVPLMRKSKVVKWVVTKTFADPLVSYGKYYYGQNKHGVIYSPVKNFWMKVFDIVGGDTKFIRENGEVV